MLYAAQANVWKTLTLGQFKSVKEGMDAVREHGYEIDPGGSVVLQGDDVIFSAEKRDVDIILASTIDLEFPAEAGIDSWEVFQRALEHGFRLCPPEIGLLLCLSLVKKELKKFRHGLIVAMMPTSAEGCNPGELLLYCDTKEDQCVLSASVDNPTHTWTPDVPGVFVKPRQ